MIKYNWKEGLPVRNWTMPDKDAIEFGVYVKQKYPKLWSKGGNIFGNEAFKILLKVNNRGYWLKEEELFYKKWQSFIVRHKHNSKIEGVVANLKWASFGLMGENRVKSLVRSYFIKFS